MSPTGLIGVSPRCLVTCTNCHALCPIDWRQARKTGDRGFDLPCPTCRRTFNFTNWEYRSACPTCQRPFTSVMHTITSTHFAYRRRCDGCGAVFELARDGDASPFALQIGNVFILEGPEPNPNVVACEPRRHDPV
jgi:hypothetical protein